MYLLATEFTVDFWGLTCPEKQWYHHLRIKTKRKKGTKKLLPLYSLRKKWNRFATTASLSCSPHRDILLPLSWHWWVLGVGTCKYLLQKSIILSLVWLLMPFVDWRARARSWFSSSSTKSGVNTGDYQRSHLCFQGISSPAIVGEAGWH